MSYRCEVKAQEARAVVSIRRRAAVQDLPRVLGEGYGAIAHYLAELGEQPAGPPFAAYYNMDMSDLDVEMGFPVARPLPGRGEIGASEIPRATVAACVHTGPYSEMAPAYDALSKWMKDNGHEPTGVVYETYLNDPDETPPEELKTQICFLLKSP